MPKCKEIRKVEVYIEDRKSIWLSIDDVEWALTYLFTQNQLKGVPLVDDDDAGPGAPRNRNISLVKEELQMRVTLTPW